MDSKTTTESRKRKPKPKRQNNKQFTKFNILPEELRHHVLTYSKQRALFKYSQCSKVCNSEIQQFNTKAPCILSLMEVDDGILVAFNNRRFQQFLVSENENIMDDVTKFFESFYKYIKEGKTKIIKIHLSHWPTEVLKINKILETETWDVTIYRSMFTDCIEFVKSNNKMSALYLHKGEEVDTLPMIPRDFFKCEAIKNLKELTTTRCEIDDDDFLNLWPDYLTITSSLSFDLIREKVRRFNGMEPCHTRSVKITLPDDDDRILELNTLFPAEMFPLAQYFYDDFLNFGRAHAKIGSQGKSLCVYRCDVAEI